MRASFALFGTLSSLFFAGCIQTAMLPANQLDSGEVVASAAIDVPRATWMPGVSGQVSVGMGGGDVTANVGSGLGVLGGGIAGRYYLSDDLNAEMEVRGGRVLDGYTFFSLAGVQTVPTDRQPWYVGVHAGAMSGREPGINTTPGPQTTVPLLGLTAGIGHIELGKRWHMQIELDANFPVPPGDNMSAPPNRLSIGFFRRF